MDAANNRVGIGTAAPSQQLHVEGNARITGSVGTPTTITGRNASGEIGNIAVGSGLSLAGGTLSAKAVPISNVNFPFLNIQPSFNGTYTLDTTNAPNYTLWVSAPKASSECSILLPNPNTMVGRTVNIIAAGGDTRVCSSAGNIVVSNSTNLSIVPATKRFTLQASNNFGGMWAVINKDF